MTATTVRPGAPQAPLARPAALAPVLRFELAKLVSQWRVRLLVLACWVAPAAFVAAVSTQPNLPADTVFGRWMMSSGWAASLVVLAFCCTWALPVLAALVVGDVFAAEDRLGTWRHLVVAVRSPQRIFVAKAVASVSLLLTMVLGLAVSSVVGGLAVVGAHPLVGLDGRVIPSGESAALVATAWACVALATLTYAAVGLLGSVALGRSPMGLLAPALLGLVLQSAQMLPLPVWLRCALPSEAFLAWRGLFTQPQQRGPLVVGLLVALAWTVVTTLAAYRLFVRRDFTDLAHDGGGRRALTLGVAPLLALTALVAAGLAVAAPARGSGVDQAKLERSLSTAFAHLYVLQTQQLHRPAVTEAELGTSATCLKGGTTDETEGPGNDWRCTVTWHLPQTTAQGSAIYQLDVTPDGRYVADGDGPKEVNGYFRVATPTGDQPNPLWQIDGLVDLLARSSSEG